jgi:hypothetical protein
MVPELRLLGKPLANPSQKAVCGFEGYGGLPDDSGTGRRCVVSDLVVVVVQRII